MAILFVEDNPDSADLIVCIVPRREDAQLLVCDVDSPKVAFGSDTLWCYVDDPELAHHRVYFSENRKGSDLLITKVTYRAKAGWRLNHRLQGALR